MNEYNHHRIIERVASKIQQDSTNPSIHLDDTKKQILKDASNFTDFFLSPIELESAKHKYYFYLFNYDITIEGNNTIKLTRITENNYFFGPNNSIQCMKNSGEKLLDGSYSFDGWDPSHDEKEFFSSVNDRKRSPNELELTYSSIQKLLVGRPENYLKELDKSLDNLLDTANQSDNVAFLHAMRAKDENKDDSRKEFEKHLKKCFSEYLFLEKEEDALFMLGIAFHGIMDSFTPSHMDFQKYTEQDMGLHSQGDVIPIKGKYDEIGNTWILKKGTDNDEESVCFEPGQIKKESEIIQLVFKKVKRYDDNDFVNPVEYKMLQIFFHISDIQVSYGEDWGGVGDIDYFWQKFRKCTIKQINDNIGNGNYKYGTKSYAYSEAAIKVISDIYKFLYEEREKCKSYAYYKKEKGKEKGIVDKALDYWKCVYDGEDMKVIREDHIRLSLYSKDQKLDEEYKEWVAQQNIDRLNRLKG